MPGEERAEIIQRLHVVGENLCSIHALVETGAPCGQILHQFGAVQTELQSIKFRMLTCQVNTSKQLTQFDPCVETRMAELQHLFELYITLVQST